MAKTNLSKSIIVKQIREHFSSKYPTGIIPLKKWKVGITRNVTRRKAEMLREFGNSRLPYFAHWTAKNSKDALEIEKTYCGLGMIRCNSQRFHTDESINVYIYRLPNKKKPKA